MSTKEQQNQQELQQQRAERFTRLTQQTTNQSSQHFLSRGNSVSNIPWWVITMIVIMIAFAMIFIIQFVSAHN